MNKIINHHPGGYVLLHFFHATKFLYEKIVLLTSLLVAMAMDLYGQTNNYFGNSGTLNGNFWSTIPAGPYISSLNSTGGAVLNFNNPATITGATLNIAGINATADVTWSNAGTLQTGGVAVPVNVAAGVTFNMNQDISVAASTGLTKTGSGIFALSRGSTYLGGFTLNNGTIIVGGENALGNNTLQLNGGIIASNATRNLNGKYPGGITIGGNIQFGDVGVLANSSANLSFDNNLALGATNRQLTLGNNGIITFGGIISGTGGLSFTANANGSGLFDITNGANSFTGPANILGGRVRFAADGSFGNATNTILIDGGQLLNSSTFSINATHLIKLGTSAGTGIDVASGSLTIDAVIADNTTNGGFTKHGPGTLMLTNANTYTGVTTINALGGTLHLNKSGGGTLPATNNIVQNGGTLKISTNQTLNNVSLIGGNITVDNGATLTINGTFDYFPPGTITLSGSGKIAYGPTGTLKYSGAIAKTITALEFPATSSPVNIICNNSISVALPFNRTITGSLTLATGTFNIGAGVLLDLNGASLVAMGGFLAGDAINNATADLMVRGTTGGTVIIPTNNINIGLRNVTVDGNRTVGLNGVNDLHLSGALSIAGTATFDNGGESQVISGGGTPSITIAGKFINRDQHNFTGTNGAIPGITLTLAAGSTIEYGLANGSPQIVTARADYSNVVISGSGTKTPSNAFSPVGTITITGTAVFDCTANNIGDINTNLTMNSGRLIVGTGGTQPSMEGVYQLNGGVVEFAGITSKTVRTKTYQNIEITGSNVGNSSGNITLNSLGTFTVKSGGSFTINDNTITGPAGTQTVTVENGAVFNCGNNKGFNGFFPMLLENSSLHPDIEFINLVPGSTINYSRDNHQDITVHNGLVYQNLVIGGNVGIKTAPSSTLTVMGNLSKTGSSIFAHNNGHIIFSNASAVQGFTNTGSTGFNVYDLTNNNTFGTGLAVNSNISVANVLTLSATSKLNLATGDITLSSTATNTARVAMVPPTASIDYASGRFNVQRYFPGDRSWRLITSPLSSLGTTGTIFSNWQNNGVYTPGIGTVVTGKLPGVANGLDDSFFDNYSMKKFENNAYMNVDNTLVPISKGLSLNGDNIGYFMFVRGDRNPANTIFPNTNNTTLTSRGKLQVGTQVLPGLTRTGAGRYFAMVGNPFASPVYFKDLVRVNLLNRFVVWDPKINEVGAFIEFDDFYNDGIYTQSKASPGGQDLNIQSGQAFFVETDAVVGPASISFEEIHKTPIINQGMFRPNRPVSKRMGFRSSLNLVNADGTVHLADGNLAEFNIDFHDAVDFQDALKFGNINENFSLRRHKALIGMERRPLIGISDTLFFNLTQTSQRNYQFLFEPENLDPLLMAFLVDKHTGIKTSLSVSSPSVVSFSITAATGSAAPDRFSVVFKQATPLAAAFMQIKARQKANGILVEWTVENEAGILKYEVEKSADGVAFKTVNTRYTTSINSNMPRYQWYDANPVNGLNFYRIKSIATDLRLQYSNVVKAISDLPIDTIILKNNPVIGGEIEFQFLHMPAGKYNIRILNQLGQLISTSEIYHSGGSSTNSFRPGINLISGLYNVVIIQPHATRKCFRLMVK